MKIIYIILVLIMCSSCAPMPNSTQYCAETGKILREPHLFKGLIRPAELDEIEITIHRGIFETGYVCFTGISTANKVLSIIGNAGIVPACAYVWDVDNDGVTDTCEVYVMFDYFLDHELQHCRGYDDVLY